MQVAPGSTNCKGDSQAATSVSGKGNWLQAPQLRLEAPARLQLQSLAASWKRDAYAMAGDSAVSCLLPISDRESAHMTGSVSLRGAPGTSLSLSSVSHMHLVSEMLQNCFVGGHADSLSLTPQLSEICAASCQLYLSQEFHRRVAPSGTGLLWPLASQLLSAS